jgi:aldose 1-epimerase
MKMNSQSRFADKTRTAFFPDSRAGKILRRTLAAMALLACNFNILADNPPQAPQPESSQMNQASNDFPSTFQRHYGTLPGGEGVTLVTLRNTGGIEVDVISYGGIITRLVTPDAKGQQGDIVLGLDNLEDYVSSNPYFGALIGRYGNRIAGGQFTLDGKTYTLDTNDGKNHLHGGVQGFDKKNWNMSPFVTETSAGVVLTLTSPDGDQGYPGELKARVTYELTNDNDLDMRFSATTDKPTIVNLTQHSYFNLAGKGDMLGHELMIDAGFITPVGEGLIPTGEILPVDGGPFDFRQAKPIGHDIGADDEQMALGLGYDHNYVLKNAADDELVLAARVTEPGSGRVLEVLTIEPGVQFYSGNFLDGSLQGKGQTYGYRSGFCLEPQHFPDSPNQPGFPSTVLLPGETYQTRIIYRFSTVDKD